MKTISYEWTFIYVLDFTIMCRWQDQEICVNSVDTFLSPKYVS
jgi:hypothetical protein